MYNSLKISIKIFKEMGEYSAVYTLLFLLFLLEFSENESFP